MRLLFVSLSFLLFSCNSKENKENESIVLGKHVEVFHSAKLNNDDILILEVHYPHILKKIITIHALEVQDVLVLHEIGMDADILIHLIKYTGSIYMLTTDDVVTLQLRGVPLEVINYMIES